MLNDADAAGLAEMKYGSGRHLKGATLLLTIGTGIGSALFIDHNLVPNTELGHLIIEGQEAEDMASGRTRQVQGWSYLEWVERLNRVLAEYEKLIWPDNIIIGGGISSAFHDYKDQIKTRATCLPASFQNGAGIVGAALWSSLQESAHV